MSEDNILVIKNGEEWNRWVRSAKAYDFYHLYSYHRLAEKQGEGQPLLIVYKEGDKFVAIPFLIRRLWEVEGLEEAGKGLSDITSVYGYAGPLSNIETIEPEFLERFLKHLRHSFADNKVVAAFSRLHPILDNHIFFPEEQIVKLGKTVSIDLSLPQEAQRKFFRKNHIRNIKKAYKTGVEVRVDETWEHLDDFIAIYESTMD
ncbi:MAG: peptidoglycan bridge formation glycyltransferase FemA/FemB family protein, partial [bacterium]|nr:peptidoglycan bridge formation glycyltransferase FemA/FemB family protein [bacterium]